MEPRLEIGTQTIESRITPVLRCAIGLAATLVLAGGVIFLSQNGLRAPEYQSFQALSESDCSLKTILEGVLQARGESLILMGTLVLLVTPLIRVINAFLGFIKLRDRLYMAVSLVVLVTLLVSLAG